MAEGTPVFSRSSCRWPFTSRHKPGHAFLHIGWPGYRFFSAGTVSLQACVLAAGCLCHLRRSRWGRGQAQENEYAPWIFHPYVLRPSGGSFYRGGHRLAMEHSTWAFSFLRLSLSLPCVFPCRTTAPARSFLIRLTVR